LGHITIAALGIFGGNMSIDEFNRTKWGCGMFAMYNGEKYPIVSCDFNEAIVALSGVTLGSNEPVWVRCENITVEE